MNFVRCDVAGAWVVDPTPHRDDRGWFMRAWCAREFADQGIDFTPRQANLIRSVRAGNGPGRCGDGGLRAPARCVTVPRGTTETSSRGARLKLTVVRRNRAGQSDPTASWLVRTVE